MCRTIFLTILFCISCLGKNLPKYKPTDGPLFLTPYIESGETEKAKNISVVDPDHFAGFSTHAAYLTVNKTNKWHLFFWYFPVQGVPIESSPLIIWLQGGPGCSSLYGLFEEIGPLQINDGKLERKPITWGANYSLLFIDNPVGAGFSFTEDPYQYVTNQDMVGASLLSFIQQFLQVFPELRTAPLFIAGESYAGKYIPAFGHYIHHNQNKSKPINLKGLAIGNGWTDPPTLLHYSEWALQVGLIDPEQATQIHQLEEEARKHWDEHNLTAFEEIVNGSIDVSELVKKIKLRVPSAYLRSPNLLYTPVTRTTYRQNSFLIRKANKAYHLLISYAPIYIYNYVENSPKRSGYEMFLNRGDIQGFLHAKKMDYIDCNFYVYQHLHHDIYDTVKPWLEELLEHYGVMCYSGQLDMRVAYALSVNTYRSFNWSGQQAYINAERKAIYDETETRRINSFVKASGNFMDVMVRSAGHMVPADQPGAAKQIIDMFIQKFK